jgi:hypothetical protein
MGAEKPVGKSMAELIAPIVPSLDWLIPSASASNFDRGNAFDAIEQFNFTDQSGKMIRGGELRNQVGDSEFTVSFSLDSCATGMCTPENMNMHTIASKFPNMKHIVINANPSTEAINQEARDSYAGSIGHGSIKPDNLIVLYPMSNEDVPKISSALGNVVFMGAENAIQHSGVISFYNADGSIKDCLMANTFRSTPDIQGINVMQKGGLCR